MTIILTVIKFLIEYRWFIMLGVCLVWFNLLTNQNTNLSNIVKQQNVELTNLSLYHNNYVLTQHAIQESNKAHIQQSFAKTVQEKDNEIESLRLSVITNMSNTDSLYKTLDQYTTSVSDNNTTSNQTTIQHITFLDKLYREALENGRESSSAVEEVKIELRHCMSDIDSIYTINKTNSIGNVEEK